MQADATPYGGLQRGCAGLGHGGLESGVQQRGVHAEGAGPARLVLVQRHVHIQGLARFAGDPAQAEEGGTELEAGLREPGVGVTGVNRLPVNRPLDRHPGPGSRVGIPSAPRQRARSRHRRRPPDASGW